jgi:hypothetical protein
MALSVKYKEVYLHAYRNRREAQQRLRAYFETYNSRRLHQALEYRPPDEVYFDTGLRTGHTGGLIMMLNQRATSEMKALDHLAGVAICARATKPHGTVMLTQGMRTARETPSGGSLGVVGGLRQVTSRIQRATPRDLVHVSIFAGGNRIGASKASLNGGPKLAPGVPWLQIHVEGTKPLFVVRTGVNNCCLLQLLTPFPAHCASHCVRSSELQSRTLRRGAPANPSGSM